MTFPTAFKLFLLAGLAALTACGGGGSGSSAPPLEQPASCSVADQRAWLRAYMNEQYFWYASQGTPDEGAATMDAYFRSLLDKKQDRFSYSQPTPQYNQGIEGRQTGYGYSLAWADAAMTVLKVRFVEPASPVAAAGLQRGESIVSIDGYTPAQVAAGSPPPVTTEGVPRSFVVSNPATGTRGFTVNSATFPVTPVPVTRVFDVPVPGGGTAKVGYVLFQQFINPASAPLGAAVESLRAAGVLHVVVDLRYNGGGSTSVARNLASMLGGSALNGSPFLKFRFNDKLSASNFNFSFTSAGLPAAPLEGLGRVIFLTSYTTASASEAVINSLKPFRDVVTIGNATYGKSYAFQPREACGTTYSAVNLITVNASDAAVPDGGLVPTCAVPDDLGRALGDPAEARLAAALRYVSTGACPASSSLEGASSLGAGAAPEAAFGETARPWMRVD